ncbi:hypothetical protein TrVE_jg55 [Triparma verrucosa]|uniref:Peroxin-5 n=1 Tax=Triparma verrucosa TaxID=1606542 RepID=A0A9W7BUA9_9STRA|nr:hypothetical protein TrVE_jg55 [Triparma verrucosa]
MASCNPEGFALDSLTSSLTSSTLHSNAAVQSTTSAAASELSTLGSNLATTMAQTLNPNLVNINVKPIMRDGNDMRLDPGFNNEHQAHAASHASMQSTAMQSTAMQQQQQQQQIGEQMGIAEAWSSSPQPLQQQQQTPQTHSSLPSPSIQTPSPYLQSQALLMQNAVQMQTLTSLKTGHNERKKQLEKEHLQFQQKQAIKAQNLDEIEEAWLDTQLSGVSMEELSKAWLQAEAEIETEVSSFGSEPPRTYNYTTSLPPPSPSIDYFKLGVQNFTSGNLKTAIQNFESSLKISPASETWSYLARCHAESDDDSLAIICYENGVGEDCYDLDMLLGLSVCYVNEGDDVRAKRSLTAWVKNNPEYNSIPSSDIETMLESCLKIKSTPKLLRALGVVYNQSRKWSAAISCLKESADLEPSHEVYNKLGATLANSGDSASALKYYNKAIEIKPRYARCWLNLGISHSNLRNYEDAVRCYLQVISLNEDMKYVWGYLRVALTCLERWELLEKAGRQDLEGFRADFDFI